MKHFRLMLQDDKGIFAEYKISVMENENEDPQIVKLLENAEIDWFFDSYPSSSEGFGAEVFYDCWNRIRDLT